jgi:hypothetical protein
MIREPLGVGLREGVEYCGFSQRRAGTIGKAGGHRQPEFGAGAAEGSARSALMSATRSLCVLKRVRGSRGSMRLIPSC